jgi:hypothetical protein
MSEAFDLVMRWLCDTCQSKVALLRAHPATGEMRAIRLSWGAAPPAGRSSVARVGFARSMGSTPSVSVRTKPNDPLLAWLRGEVGEVKEALVAPIVVNGHIWGAIVQPAGEAVPRDVCSRALRAAALALSQHVQRDEDDRPRLDPPEKGVVGPETFLRRVDQSWTEGEGSTVLLAAAFPPAADAAETRASVAAALRAAMATARANDSGTHYAEDVALLLLTRVADVDLARLVQRFRSSIWRCSPGAPTAGISALAVTPAGGSARDQADRLVVAARMLRVRR